MESASSKGGERRGCLRGGTGPGYQHASAGERLTHPLLLKAANAPPDSVERHLLIVAAVEAILDRPVVLVGGAAVNVVTGTYYPTDLDLVASVTTADRRRLVAAGFEWAGVGYRHLSITMPDGEVILVEFPDSDLDAVFPPEQIEIDTGVFVSIISLNDLVMDRLRQATDGTLVTLDAAIDLALAAYASIDWDWLDQRAELPELEAIGVPDVLTVVRQRAKRRLRASGQFARGGTAMTQDDTRSLPGTRAIAEIPESETPVEWESIKRTELQFAVSQPQRYRHLREQDSRN